MWNKSRCFIYNTYSFRYYMWIIMEELGYFAFIERHLNLWLFSTSVVVGNFERVVVHNERIHFNSLRKNCNSRMNECRQVAFSIFLNRNRKIFIIKTDLNFCIKWTIILNHLIFFSNPKAICRKVKNRTSRLKV